MPRPRRRQPDPARFAPCARCGQCYPGGADSWPEGRVCKYCYLQARLRTGTYAGCGALTSLPGLNASGQPTCPRCSGIPARFRCGCGREVTAGERGTFRYAWTQGIGRLRWTAGKLVPLAVAVTAAAGAFTVLFAWYNQPFFAAGYAIPLSTRVFGLLGVAFAAWTLAAFAIGALAGMLIRRAVPAIAATLAAYAGLALATGLWLRQHYITPLLTSSPNPPGSAWSVSQWYTRGGTFAFGARGSRIINALSQLCHSSNVPPAQCLSQHGYTQWTSYQPGSRFWPFQWIEGGWLLALSVLLIAATVWLVRRRAA